MNREQAKKIVMATLEDNVGGLEMSDEKMDQTLVDDLGVDSLDLMLIMMEISESSGVTINDDQAEVLDTPEKIVEFITRN